MLTPHLLAARAAAPVATHHPAVVALLAHGLELLPLFGCKGGADVEEHARIGLLEVGTRLGDFIDLSKDLRLIGLVGGDHGLHEDFLFFEVGVEVDQIEAMLLKDGIHFLLLIAGDVELLGDVGIVPPAAELAVVKDALHGTALEAAMIAAAWAVGAGAGRWTAHPLGKGET